MGCYVNPKNEIKEKWLKENGEIVQDWFTPTDRVHFKPYKEYCTDNKLPVIMVDNGPFRAAAVAYNESEFLTFLDTKFDPRTRIFYIVDVDKLLEVSDLATFRPDLVKPKS